ncbi:hypothetical protein NQ317_004158 [Molorchus minor]|uniref:Cell division control protein n=1 Tax=Molorchus minor TaxID=1323400 RepID=A0ABQ9JSE7_9CUCU|nr:hypothetical protein NQ317_004158 [Molorchus minor]
MENELHPISPVTPPKQKKLYQENFRTPQHRKTTVTGTQSPSTLIRLGLIDTEQENIKTNSSKEKKNRKTLFENSSDDIIVVEDAPKEDDKFGNKESERKSNIYQNARRALHSMCPTDMPGREKELDELRTFIKTHLEGETSGSLYVSGPPGTGKTASLNMILESEQISSKLCKGYVNCTAVKSPTAIYSRITKELGVKISGKTEKDYLSGLGKYFKKNSKMTLLVLDEMDQLETKNQSVLYTIFEWPSKPNSRLILVGIANALDLTDRILPRLQARCDLKPTLMHFAPYTKQQIIQIFTTRLKSAGALEVFSSVALQILAAKVAAVSGDVRRALDIGRRVVELIDKSKNCDILKPVENLVSELVDKERNDEIKPKAVDLKDVVDVLNNVYGTSQNFMEHSDDSFPLQQKILICSLVLILKKAKNKDVTVGKLHEVYRRVCSKRNLLAVDQAEFVGLCSLIETRGIIRVTGRKEPRLNRVSLEWDEEEVGAALKDKQLMAMILQDDDCLGKL